jgi:hypothetical protein
MSDSPEALRKLILDDATLMRLAERVRLAEPDEAR